MPERAFSFCIKISRNIDPPYNTGNDFVYSDDYKDNLQNYLELTGQTDNEGRKLGNNSDTNGRYHTNWLNMMYPRLRLARNLLTDDGVIFISINDVEIDNLKKICHEVFGEENFICNFIRKGSGGRQDSKYYAIVHEYILCYSKNIGDFISGEEIKENEVYPFYDEEKQLKYKTQLLRKWGENSKRSDRPNLFYAIIDPDGNEHYPMLSENEESCWRWSQTKMKEEISSGRVEFKKRNNEWIAYEKIFEPTDDNPKSKLFTTIIDDISNLTGASLLKELFDEKIFDYPKPVDLLRRIINIANCKKNDIILDFFSGSATTAHAVMQLNAEDGGNRKFIMVQLPESTDEKDEAYKAGYKNICEIGKERIRRAGEKIVGANSVRPKDTQQIEMETGEHCSPLQKLDIGFKVLKLDSSNIKKWNPDYENLENSLYESIGNFIDDRTELDVVYEIMLKYGLPLDLPVKQLTMPNSQCTIYLVDNGKLVICLSENISTEIAKFIVQYKKDNSIDEMRVVFKDNGFKDDSSKTNVKEILKSAGVEEFVTV